MSERTGLYGGSFDPVHLGHLIIARAVAEALDLQRVVFLPSASPPHKSAGDMAPPQHRAEMVRLAIDDDPLFELDDYDLTRAGPSYTIDTVAHFRERLGPQAVLHWIIGADSLAELSTWRRVPELIDACRIVTAARPGWDRTVIDSLRTKLTGPQIARLQEGVVKTPHIEISATDIRNRLQQGRSIRYLVPDAVRVYIADHRLY